MEYKPQISHEGNDYTKLYERSSFNCKALTFIVF